MANGKRLGPAAGSRATATEGRAPSEISGRFERFPRQRQRLPGLAEGRCSRGWGLFRGQDSVVTRRARESGSTVGCGPRDPLGITDRRPSPDIPSV